MEVFVVLHKQERRAKSKDCLKDHLSTLQCQRPGRAQMTNNAVVSSLSRAKAKS